ncbi:hypothetical protein DL767_010006 [Monosporascus sp. MG133]|nr:hypothetical protein DL767_010006 [Monosporascus sp. MG133]
MDGDPSITFGIETETVTLGDPDPPGAYQKDRWKANAKPLSEALTKVGVAVELASPIFDYSGGQRGWGNKLRQVFDVLCEEPFRGKPSGTCSLQVRVAILPGWSASDIKGVARAVMRYGPEFEALAARFGRDRAASAGAKANSVENIGENDTNSPPGDPGVPRVPAHHGGRRRLHLAEGGRVAAPPVPLEFLGPGGPAGSENSRRARVKWLGTVEFRLVSGTTRLEDAVVWINFANLFVRAAAPSSRAEGHIRLVEFGSRKGRVSGVGGRGHAQRDQSSGWTAKSDYHLFSTDISRLVSLQNLVSDNGKVEQQIEQPS